MKKYLLSSVAILSIFVGTKIAEAAEAKYNIKVFGSLDFAMEGIQETYPKVTKGIANSPKSLEGYVRLRVNINPEAKLGTTAYGALLRLNTNRFTAAHGANYGTVGYDRANVYVSDPTFGKITIGRAFILNYASSTGTVYGGNGSVGFGVGSISKGYSQKGISAGGNSVLADEISASYSSYLIGSNWNRINIESPVLFGIQAGVSYTPRFDNQTGTDPKTGLTYISDAGGNRAQSGKGYQHGIEVGLKYSEKFDFLAVTVAAGYAAAQAVSDITLKGDTANINNLRSYGFSTTISAYGVILNAVFANAGSSSILTDAAFMAKNKTAKMAPTIPRAIGYTVNLGYKTGDKSGDFSVGGYAGHGQASSNNPNRNDPTRHNANKVTSYGIGGQYTIITGLNVFLGLDYVDFFTDNASAPGVGVDTSRGTWHDKQKMITVGSTVTF